MSYREKKIILDALRLNKTISRMAVEILERNELLTNLVFIGLQTRGVFLAERLASIIEKNEGIHIPIGVLDISLYRDDFATNKSNFSLKETDFPVALDDKNIIIVDDVLYTGRSIRAAMECIMDFGRPKCIRLAVLIDRGHRELPIEADFVGKKFITIPGKEKIAVNLEEIDQEDQVLLMERIDAKE